MIFFVIKGSNREFAIEGAIEHKIALDSTSESEHYAEIYCYADSKYQDAVRQWFSECHLPPQPGDCLWFTLPQDCANPSY